MLALRTGLLAALVALSLVPDRGEAQSFYYRSIPLGERAIGLATAYTGIADDPSATYYNPGGLLSGGRFQLLGSLSSLVFTQRKVEQGFDSASIGRELKSSGTTTLPHFVGTVVKFGKKFLGDYRYALAYSSFEVARESLGVGFSDAVPEASADLAVGSNYRMRWWGVSFAMRATKKVSVGISTFLSSQSYDFNEDIGLAEGGTLEASGLRVGGTSTLSTTRIGTDSWHFVFRLGALYRINARWQIGFMFQPPGAPIKERGSVFRRFVADSPSQESAYFLFNQGDFEIKSPIPFEMRSGVEYKINALTTLSVDVAVTGPIRDEPVFARPPQLGSLMLDVAGYYANSTERRTTPNASIGAEHLFGKVVVAGGLGTNLSAAPNVPETTTEYTPPQIDLFSAAFAVGVDTKGYRLTIGATGFFGVGDALTLTVDPQARAVRYNRSRATLSAVLLYIAGAVSVASRGAKDVQDKYKERKERKAVERNGGADPKPEAGTEADPSVEPEPGPDAELELGPDPDPEPGPEPDPEPAPDPES